MNVNLKRGFSQVCVWPACEIEVSKLAIQEFEDLMKDNMNVKVQFLEQIRTEPDIDEDGMNVPDTGGRSDLFFAIHDDDIGIFAVPRLQFGISWIEDVLAKENYHSPIYPSRVFEYAKWNKENLADV